MINYPTNLPRLQITHNDIAAGRVRALQAEMASEHGPIFVCEIANGPETGEYVCMVGPEASRFVLHTGREHFSHDRGWTPIIGEPLGQGLLNMDPPEHTRHRKLWNPSFTAAAMEAYLPILQQVIAGRTDAWTQQVAVDVYRESQQITFAAAAWALAGIAPGPQLAELAELFTGRAPRERRDKILLDIIAARRAAPPDTQPHDVVGAIVRARDENGQPLDNEQIMAHINILLVAGYETTTVLSAWVLYLLATMPEQRRRIEAELDGLLGDAPGPITVDVLRGMKQLDAFIKEAGRLYAPVLSLPRGVVSDFSFGGYTIPAGAQLRLALGAGHLLPHIFAEPQRFDPDRFAPPREEDRHTPYGLITFGGGTRVCIGINFATIEIKALAAHVLRHYQLEAVERPPAHAGALLASIDGGLWLRVQPGS